MLRKATVICPLATLLFQALLAAPAQGEKGGANKAHFDLRGKVTIASELPRPEATWWATVLLEEADGSLRRQVVADTDGSFHFDKVPEGRYQIAVYARGFREIRRTVEVTRTFADAQGRVSVDIELNERDLPSARERAGRSQVSVDQLSVPERARKEYERARKAMMRGDSERMRRHLEKAIQIAPNFVQALNDLGTYYHRERDYNKAIDLFSRALKIDPDSFAPQVNLGGSLISAGRFSEAVQANGRALQMRPEDPLANAQMGIALFMLGDYSSAIPYLEKVKAIDPGSSTYPQLFLAEIHLKLGDTKRATQELEDFLAQHPDMPDAPNIRKRIEELKKD